jgi:HD-GYP domain-containing protein (c-di-GMP phosphodiesterase class II)
MVPNELSESSTVQQQGREAGYAMAWVRRRRLLIPAGLFAAIFGLRVADQRPGDAIFVLCVVPIVLVAIELGPCGGMAAASVGLGLTAIWALIEGADVGPGGYAARALAFAVVGIVVGGYAVQARLRERELELARDVAVGNAVTENERSEHLERKVAERTRDVQSARVEVLRRLALAAEYRDDDTHRHTQRVGNLAAMLAERMGESRDFVEHISLAAPLHDIGKLRLPDAILLKRGRLTDEERDIMQTHTTHGATILAGSAYPVLTLGEEIALTHHECWDGSGYPAGLHGDAIPLAGRIVAIADVFDALTHARPYKPAWPFAAAVEEIVRCSGTHFDPRVVDAFRQLHFVGAVDRSSPGRLRRERSDGALDE